MLYNNGCFSAEYFLFVCSDFNNYAIYFDNEKET